MTGGANPNSSHLMDMESVENHIALDKNDNFFDDDLVKQNGEVPVTLQNGDDASPVTADTDNKGEEVKAEDNIGEDKTDDAPPAADDVSHKDDDIGTAGGDVGEGDGSKAPAEEGEVHAENGTQGEQADEGFQSTSPVPQTDDVTATSPVPATDDVTAISPIPATDDVPAPDDVPATDDVTATSPVPVTDDVKTTSPVPTTELGMDDHASQMTHDDETKDMEDALREAMGEEGAQVKGHGEEDGDHDYEDSFSQCSQKSLASIDSTGKTMNTKMEPVNPEADGNNATGEFQVQGNVASPLPSSSPTPSDNRAEAGAVVPVVEQTSEDQKTDGRSSVDVKENGEYRGEDRTEVSLPEGTEDSRGQGQWPTAEQQYFASAVLVQKSEKEAMQELEEERDALLQDQKDMKCSLLDLEKELEKKSDFLAAEKEINAGKEKTIKDLKAKLDSLYAKQEQGEGSQERIKDLQERLAILARENEEKDERISKLTEKLSETSAQLKETERQLLISEASKQSSNAEAPKSKTCAIM